MRTNRASVALKRLCAKHRAFPKGKGRKHEYNADSVLRKQFSGDMVSAKPRLLSDFASGGGGVWGGILRLLHPFSFGEILGGQKAKIQIHHIIKLSLSFLCYVVVQV